MKKYYTTLYRSTAPGHSVRIGMCYSSLTRKNSRKSLQSIVVRLGHSVIVIRSYREEPVLTMLRRTLIALCLYHRSSSHMQLLNPKRDIQKELLRISNFPKRSMYQKLMKLPLYALMDELSLLTEKPLLSALPVRISLDYSCDFLTFFLSLHERFIVSLLMLLTRRSGVLNLDSEHYPQILSEMVKELRS